MGRVVRREGSIHVAEEFVSCLLHQKGWFGHGQFLPVPGGVGWTSSCLVVELYHGLEARGLEEEFREDVLPDSSDGWEVTYLQYHHHSSLSPHWTLDHHMPPFQPGCCRGERCKSGTGENIATAVIDYLESVGVSTADTEILGADGTTVNTGHLNGSMRNMELRLGRPLQRAVCTLHQAELPLRKMFEHLDGPTTGPRSYSGPIGKLLKSDQLHLTPLNHHFTPLHLADIPPLSPEVKEKMSTDAVLLHDHSM